MNMTAVILAAGKGTRMHSDKPKVLQTLLGEPMLRHVREALRPVFGDRVVIVAGHRAELVEAAFAGERFVRQTEQLGTGHALAQALPELRAAGCDMERIWPSLPSPWMIPARMVAVCLTAKAA